MKAPLRTEDQLFENLGDGKFKDASVERGSYFKEEKPGFLQEAHVLAIMTMTEISMLIS